MRYWEQRAERYGVRSVVHIEHSEAEVQAVTKRQKRILLPLFREQLRGDEKLLLDFGCGPGRFTADLAALVGGRAVGLDPIQRLLDLAPADERTSYVRSLGTAIPARDRAFDAVWICQTLGGIVSDGELERTASEIRRVLKPGGLLFLVENTSEKPDGDYWRFHPVQAYRDLFQLVSLTHLADYTDLGERNSVLSGRNHE